MSTLLVWREKLQRLYASYSIYMQKGIQFILGLLLRPARCLLRSPWHLLYFVPSVWL